MSVCETTWDYQAAVRFLDEHLDVSVQKLGLDRIRDILSTLDNPQDRLPMIHIGGSNGKGSTSAMLDAILSAAGYRTGRFTSPHLIDVRERLAVNGKLIDSTDFAQHVYTLKQHLERTLGTDQTRWPTYFEFLNGLAYQYFHAQKTDITLFEVGLGGRLDSTNVIKQPNVTVITSISLEHTHILGDTLAAIATEKAGILKPGCPLVLGPSLPEEAKTAILNIANSLDITVHQADANPLQIVPETTLENGLLIQDTQTHQHYTLSLTGTYQRDNLATVLSVIAVLREQGFDIPDAAIQAGLANTQWMGRFQYLRDHRLIIDGSHNAEGFAALGECLTWHRHNQPIYWLLSLQANRPVQPLLELVERHRQPHQTPQVIWTSGPETMRYHTPEAMSKLFKNSIAIPDYTVALETLQAQLSNHSDAIGIATGSLYTAGCLLKQLEVGFTPSAD